MEFISTVMRPLRFLLVVCTCAVLLFSSAVPAFAANRSMKQDTEAGKVYENKARDYIQTDAPPSMKDIQKNTENGGINEVQGKAGAEDMKNPSNSRDVSTAKDYIEKALDKATK